MVYLCVLFCNKLPDVGKPPPRGVRKFDFYYNNTIYVKHGEGWGVRKDGVVYKTHGNPKHTLNRMLHYSKPCVCGSLTHMRTTHVDCILNRRYLLDVVSC